nr:MAG TPA: hypothetical protein [Caudoviricetes sp.]
MFTSLDCNYIIYFWNSKVKRFFKIFLIFKKICVICVSSDVFN